MNANDRRRLYERAGILMITRSMDPTQAIIEAARQLGIIGEGTARRALEPSKRRVNDEQRPGEERGS